MTEEADLVIDTSSLTADDGLIEFWSQHDCDCCAPATGLPTAGGWSRRRSC